MVLHVDSLSSGGPPTTWISIHQLFPLIAMWYLGTSMCLVGMFWLDLTVFTYKSYWCTFTHLSWLHLQCEKAHAVSLLWVLLAPHRACKSTNQPIFWLSIYWTRKVWNSGWCSGYTSSPCLGPIIAKPPYHPSEQRTPTRSTKENSLSVIALVTEPFK